MAFKNPAIYAVGSGQQYVEVGNTPTSGEPAIFFHTGASTEVEPGLIRSSGESQPSPLELEVRGPTHEDHDPSYPTISLSTFAGPVSAGGGRFINLYADRIGVQAPVTYDTVWTSLTLVNAWAQVAGFSASYLKDAAGVVHVRGAITGGAATTIANLPVGYRPIGQLWETAAQRGGSPGPVACHLQITTAGNIVIVTNLASAQVRLSLDFSFPAISP